MSKLHFLGAIALSSFVATAAFAAQSRDNAQTATTTLSCGVNPSQEFCQVASASRDGGRFSQITNA
jgi:hypothetical protein